MSLAGWSLLIGALLLAFVILGSSLGRLPLSSAIVYLAIGVALGPAGTAMLTPDPLRHAALLESVTEVALLVSLFAVGLHLGVPLRDRRWWLPLRLAFVSMALMVGLVTAVGVWLLHMPLGAAVLLGAILAPTDPVLASDIHAEPGPKPDPLGFSLSGEGGLNDGSAFPFAMLGLGLLGLHDLGEGNARWWTADLLWPIVGGLALGGVVGALTGRLVVYLRSRHREAVGLDVFLGLGLIAVAYGTAQLLHASGFLAVLACGLAVRRVRERPAPGTTALPVHPGLMGHAYEVRATHSLHASATMRDEVQLFNGQLEKLIELAVVVLIGSMLGFAKPIDALWWFVPLLLLVLRPLSVLPSVFGAGLTLPQTGMVAWFGIRGVGSVFYLALALHHGVTGDVADLLVSLTLWSVAASIVAHGVSARPLMRIYDKRRA